MNQERPATVTGDAMHQFQQCLTDLRQTLDHLRFIEQGMADAIAQMKLQNEPRERIMVAQMMLSELRGTLRTTTAYTPRPVGESVPASMHVA